jgi:DNA gyrase inhibitor GyrI
MAELAIKINCGTDKCMDCAYLMYEGTKEYCTIFEDYPETTASSTYRLEACKKAEIKELR